MKRTRDGSNPHEYMSGGVEGHAVRDAKGRNLKSPLNGAQSPASGASLNQVRNRQAGFESGPLTL